MKARKRVRSPSYTPVFTLDDIKNSLIARMKQLGYTAEVAQETTDAYIGTSKTLDEFYKFERNIEDYS